MLELKFEECVQENGPLRNWFNKEIEAFISNVSRCLSVVPQTILARWAWQLNSSEWPGDFPWLKPAELDRPQVGNDLVNNSHFLARLPYHIALGRVVLPEACSQYHQRYVLGNDDQRSRDWEEWERSYSRGEATIEDNPGHDDWPEQLRKKRKQVGV